MRSSRDPPHSGVTRHYGGSGMGNKGAVSGIADGKGASALVTLPPLSTIMIEYDPE